MNSNLIPPGLAYLADNITNNENILGVSREQKARWAKNLNLPGKAETIFFAGCGYQFSTQLEMVMGLIRQMDKSAIGSELPMRFARFQKKLGINLPGLYSNVQARAGNTEVPALIAAIKVLHFFGIEPGYLAEEEPCCGAPLYHAGMQTKFADNARKAYDKIKAFGIKKLISVVPYCTNALSNLFPQYIDGFDLEVKHFVEVVDENLADFKPRFPRKVKVTYHDPCQLVRFLNIADEPRRILRSIENIELVETEWTCGKWSTCCGGGGGFEAVFPELSQVLAVNRTRELLETGAEMIVTHCPGCIIQLKDGLRELKVKNIEVLDLSQVVAMALEK
jgi:Fe-S oxidoreductase